MVAARVTAAVHAVWQEKEAAGALLSTPPRRAMTHT